MITVEPKYGKVVFQSTTMGITVTDTVSREEAAALMLNIAHAIVNSGDIGSPKAQQLFEAVNSAIAEFRKKE